MQSLSFPSTLPLQQRSGWTVIVSSVSWYLLLFEQTAGLGLLLVTILLVGIRAVQSGKFHVYDLLPLCAALSATLTSSPMHWLVWILCWSWSLGADTLKHDLPSHLRTVTGLLRGLISPLTMRQHIDTNLSVGLKKTISWVRIAFIPMIICGVFFAMYAIASPAFAETSETFTDWMAERLSSLNFLAIVSLIVGSLVGGWILLKPNGWPERYQFASFRGNVIRKARKANFEGLTPGLRTEYKTTYVTLLMVNVLLICYHIVDLPWIWFSYDPDLATSAQHSQLVHEGTYVLIASILLSMGILLYYFRGNLNFMKGSATLKALSYLWIAQNALLVTSVAVRNYHYIEFGGLTYKRIGVIIFLCLTLFGLVTLLIKINQNESLGKLIGKNFGLALSMAILLTALPWSRWITAYNLRHFQETGRIDLPYLIHLDGNNLDQLWGAMEYTLHNHDPYHLERKTRQHMENQATKDWRSFSLTAFRAQEKLEDSPVPRHLLTP